MNNLDVYICRGFNRYVVLPSEIKKESGLKRTALVFSPDFNGHSVLEWDCVKDCLWDAVDEIKLGFRSSIEIERDDDENDDVPLRVAFAAEGRLRCIMLAEFWCNVGGPFPYSDSYTFSFFTRSDLDDSAVMASLLKVMDSHKEITVRQVVTEAPRYSMWWRLVSLLRSLF